MRRALFVVTAGLLASFAAVTGATAPARTPVAAPAANRAAAHAEAHRLLERLPVPAGAVEVASSPAAGPWLARSGPGAPASTRLIDLHRYWRIAGHSDAGSLIDAIGARGVRGFSRDGTGEFGVGGTTVVWSVEFQGEHRPAGVYEEGATFSASAARGGGVALRADAWTIWLLPRPAWERIPAGVTAVAVSVGTYDGKRSFPVATVTAPQDVRGLVSVVDSRTVEQFDVFSCPLIQAQTLVLDLGFVRGGTRVAGATEDACGGLRFTVGRRTGRALAEQLSLGDWLWHRRILRRCELGDLTATASTPYANPGPPSRVMRVQFASGAATACGLHGYPRVTLLAAGGRALPTEVRRTRFVPPVAVVVPGAPAGTSLSWQPSSSACHGPRVAAVRVGLPGVAGELTVPVGTPGHPVAPCRGRVTLDAIG